MKFLAITLTMAGILIISGCRHDYSPTPPPYYCQPACGCAPACAPPCTPSGTTYSMPTPATMPRPVSNNGAPASTYAAPGGNSYAVPGNNPYGTPGGNASPSLPR